MIKQVRQYSKNDTILYAVTDDRGRVSYYLDKRDFNVWSVEVVPEDVKKFMENHPKKTIMTINGFETVYE